MPFINLDIDYFSHSLRVALRLPVELNMVVKFAWLFLASREVSKETKFMPSCLQMSCASS
jgi:hypothetical protein